MINGLLTSRCTYARLPSPFTISQSSEKYSVLVGGNIVILQVVSS